MSDDCDRCFAHLTIDDVKNLSEIEMAEIMLETEKEILSKFNAPHMDDDE